MKHPLNLKDWNRREVFEFFNQFEEPYFGVCVQIDCTKAYAKCKREGLSFFLYYLYKTLVVCNRVESFRYRIEEEQVMIYDTVHAGPTIARPDGSMGFAFIKYHDDFNIFYAAAQEEVERVKSSRSLFAPEATENLIHFSAIPWIDFSALSHARWLARKDCSPKISVGKLVEENGRRRMAVSIHVHHALMDGRHVGEWIAAFQQELDAD